MSNGTRVKVLTGKYKGKYGDVVGVHGDVVSVRVTGAPCVQVYGTDELVAE